MIWKNNLYANIVRYFVFVLFVRFGPLLAVEKSEAGIECLKMDLVRARERERKQNVKSGRRRVFLPVPVMAQRASNHFNCKRGNLDGLLESDGSILFLKIKGAMEMSRFYTFRRSVTGVVASGIAGERCFNNHH